MSEKNIHGGHRQRIKERFLTTGADGFQKHQLLELLLFYGIPQKDTNPIAHRLINRFGGIRAVFEASVEELCEVEGISMNTATLIKLVPAIWGMSLGEIDTSERYDTVSKLGKMLVRRYAGLTVETVLLVLLDNSWHIIDIVKLSDGSVNQVGIDTRKLVEVTIRKNASMVLLAHNHPNGNSVPSSEDLVTTKSVAKVMESIHVEFLEHLLIANNNFVPLLTMTENKFWQKAEKSEFYD